MRNMAEIVPIEQIFDRIGTAPNREVEFSPGPNQET